MENRQARPVDASRHVTFDFRRLDVRLRRPVRTGLIGCGSLSLIGILPQLAEPDAKERVELVAVCDVNETAPARPPSASGFPTRTPTAQELIARDDIDLVLVITPIEYHYPLAMDALRAGKHVYVQKTMATTYAEAREMVETARERGLTLVAAPGQMLAPAMQAMKQLCRFRRARRRLLGLGQHRRLVPRRADAARRGRARRGRSVLVLPRGGRPACATSPSTCCTA